MKITNAKNSEHAALLYAIELGIFRRLLAGSLQNNSIFECVLYGSSLHRHHAKRDSAKEQKPSGRRKTTIENCGTNPFKSITYVVCLLVCQLAFARRHRHIKFNGNSLCTWFRITSLCRHRIDFQRMKEKKSSLRFVTCSDFFLDFFSFTVQWFAFPCAICLLSTIRNGNGSSSSDDTHTHKKTIWKVT